MKKQISLAVAGMFCSAWVLSAQAQVNVGVQSATQAAVHATVPATQAVTHEATQAAMQTTHQAVQTTQSTVGTLNGQASTAISASGGVASKGLNEAAQAEAKQSTSVNASSHALLKHERKMARRAAREARKKAHQAHQTAEHTQVSASGSTTTETSVQGGSVNAHQQGNAELKAQAGKNEVKASSHTRVDGGVHH
ncbi:MAG: hypothetical protein K6T34_07680 [Thermoflavifilum sp.]|nr:hypothetical protein [Thermoflavifilum sp.]